MKYDELIRDVIALAGGRINTETRLRMIHYLLDHKGVQSGALWYYSIRHHGPHSAQFERGLSEALLFRAVEESIGYRPGDGAAYKTFTTSEPRTLPMLGALASQDAQALILRMKTQSVTLLELAASAHWFIVQEQDPSWDTTLRRRKGVLAENGRLDAAVSFLRDLDLLPATA
ncbi:MAG TPA: hypothetical protein VMU78_09920 [Methylocella sp.]|nr:hypothetical protein [Methylocella sp.]